MANLFLQCTSTLSMPPKRRPSTDIGSYHYIHGRYMAGTALLKNELRSITYVSSISFRVPWGDQTNARSQQCWIVQFVRLRYKYKQKRDRWRNTRPALYLSLPCKDTCTCTKNSKQIFPKMKLRGLLPSSYILASVRDTWMWKLGTKPHSFISVELALDLVCSVV